MSVRFSQFVGRAAGGFAAALVLASAVSAQIGEQVIFNFVGSNGSMPQSQLVQDAAGRLYGTTVQGGTGTGYGFGVVFELAPKAGGAWNFRVLHSFSRSNNGESPLGRLVLDAAGNLYGTAGTVVFELSPGTGGLWTERSIHTFKNATDGNDPLAGLTMD